MSSDSSLPSQHGYLASAPPTQEGTRPAGVPDAATKASNGHSFSSASPWEGGDAEESPSAGKGESKRAFAPAEGVDSAKRLRVDAGQSEPQEDFPLPPEAMRPFAPIDLAKAGGASVLHCTPDASLLSPLPKNADAGASRPSSGDATRGTSPLGVEEEETDRGATGQGSGGGTAPSGAMGRRGENKPVEVAPNVTRLPPYDKNVTSSILVSKATFDTVSLPSEEFRERLEAPLSGAVKEEETEKDKESEGESLLGLPDRPPVPLDEAKLREREEEAWRLAQQKEGREPYKLPSCSAWFDETKIGAIEQDLLPTLFVDSALTASEREERYFQLRQAIVSLYRSDPTKYLSFSECRRAIAADAALLLRVHSFLDYWGVINFQADPATIPSAVARRKDLLLKDIQAVQKSGEASRLPGDNADAASGKSPASLAGSSSCSLDDSPATGGAGPWRCAACGKICLYSYYVLRPGGSPGISLGVLDKCVWCLKCFADGRYPPVLTERNFLKVGLPLLGSDGKDGKWTLEETERLIEGIERYLNDWNEVAAFVGGGRTAQMCVERFIQLPIQEPLPSRSAGEDAGPFLHFKNPLLSLLAFLASTVHPSIAAAAARAALQEAVDLLGDKETPTETGETGETEGEWAGGGREANGVEKSRARVAAKKEDGEAESRSAAEKAKETEKEKKEKINERPWQANPENKGLIADRDLQAACATALAAGATEARTLAKVEEKEIGELMSEIVKLQLEKLELRMHKMQILQSRIARSKTAMENKFAQLLNEHKDLAAELAKTKEAALAAL
ncbi:hypothetical protein NCLIV_013840 [Neospora caninum Liverpool]|uniref:SWIRM domain-containing protein n=3 Tax=Neospora caninum TaxID=29176 RepID=F0VD75_NEOCL|nr:hypothetical protein NCLIV_013840 [Neospora caninum Liverpool]CBZ51590.1 hypothetical protein NCLIV_013840 [Neospora caninum Liverpool]CEL65541.1 TPA: SWIRM domain-containing protein [Neospora caninum Liverpool]|eukprot:XP_003881623.1 hypothetical protein NCLIV_013840 [Neospora caninum Liverpool]